MAPSSPEAGKALTSWIMKLASLVFVLASVGASVLGSCGGKIDCADASAQCTNGGGPAVDCTKPICPNDPPIASSQADLCRAQLAGSCGAEYAGLFHCALPLVRCTADGTTDPSVVADFTAKCSAEAKAYVACHSSMYEDAGGGWVDGGTK